MARTGPERSAGRACAAAAATILAALTCVGAAFAQVAPTYSGTSTMQTYSGDSIMQDLSNVGTCLVRRKAAQAEAFIAAPMGSPAEAAAYKALVGRSTSCLRDLSSMSVAQPLLRGAIAEALYKARFSGGAPAAPAAAAAPSADLMSQFADCYARAHPQEVHALVTRTRITTKEERAALSRMAPGFGPCLPSGVRIELRPSYVRLAFIEAFYRAAVGNSAVQAGK